MRIYSIMKLFFKTKWAVFCLLVLVVFAVFGRTVWFDYVQLDEGIILTNNWFFVSDISNFFEIFKYDINYPSNVAPYYRPMFIASFMLNSQFGSSPLVFHLGSIFLHIVAAYFVFWLFLELGFKKEISLFSSLLFAVHPAVTPVAVWVPGRIEAILAIFTLLSFIMFIRLSRTGDWRYLAGFLLSFAAALLTKEVVLSLVPILFFYYLMHRKEKRNEALVTLPSGLAGIILIWFFIRKSVIAESQIIDLSFFQMIAVLWSNISAAILYFGKTLLPVNLSVFPILESSSLVLGLVALAIAALYWILAKIRPFDLNALGLLWFIVFLAPSLISYNSPEKMVFFEHRLYLPLVGILIFFTASISLRDQVPFLQQKRYLTP